MKVVRISRLYDRTGYRRRLHIVTDQGTFALDASEKPMWQGRQGARLWHWMICRGPYGDVPPTCLNVHVLGVRDAVSVMASGRIARKVA